MHTNDLSEPKFTRLNIGVPFWRDVDPRIAKAIEFMWNNIQQPLKIPDIARAACMSKDHFKHVFRRNVGVTPKRLLRRMRFTLAQVLLTADHNRPIKQIAAECGVPATSTFVREFHRAVGISPAKFRSGLLPDLLEIGAAGDGCDPPQVHGPDAYAIRKRPTLPNKFRCRYRKYQPHLPCG